MDANSTNRGAKYFAPLFVVLRLKLRVREISENSSDIHERSQYRAIHEESSDSRKLLKAGEIFYSK